MNKNHKRINHPIPPVFDENSEILILEQILESYGSGV